MTTNTVIFIQTENAIKIITSKFVLGFVSKNVRYNDRKPYYPKQITNRYLERIIRDRKTDPYDKVDAICMITSKKMLERLLKEAEDEASPLNPLYLPMYFWYEKIIDMEQNIYTSNK